MTFWSNRRLLLRLSAAAIIIIVIRLLTHSGVDVRTPPRRSGPGYTSLDISQKSMSKDQDQDQRLHAEDGTGDPLLHDDSSTNGSPKEPSGEKDVDAIPEQMRTKVNSYVKTILDPSDSTFTGLRCPRVNIKRYSHLQVPSGEQRLKYFFALDLRQVVDLLPRLLGSIVEVMRFLGAQNCAISIVEGNSDDGTWEVLKVLELELQALGVVAFFVKETIDPSKDDRIESLARLRSLALAPLRNSRSEDARFYGLPGATSTFSEDATVIFLNDVAACGEDILELLHQRIVQEADMTCAMDWHHPGGKDGDPLFYDVWISRALSGDLFFDIPTTGSWEKSSDLFPFDPEARDRFKHHRPFQVFACWNGAVAFTAKPILNGEVDFRHSREGECFQGEPQLFCKDLWFAGYQRIAVVPSVNLEYTDERGVWIKESRGFAYQWVGEEDDEVDGAPPLRIDWKGPPDEVKCMPTFTNQNWMAWNESLV